MTSFPVSKFAAACAISAAASAAFAHVSLDEPAALANNGYRAVFNVGHGCDGSPTKAIRVSIPAGFRGAKPLPKAGWVLSTQVGKLDKPYTSHGQAVTEGVVEITWTAAARENFLPDAYFDEFVLRGSLSDAAGPLWFKVLQSCETGAVDWAQIPASGTSTKGLKSPAALLEVIPSEAVGHQH
ncbi:MAG: nuclear export factor [Rhodoferax sp.]|nr:nuclear export factor [Rhodoferax sp.]